MSKRRLEIANNPLLSGPALRDRGQVVSPVPYREIQLSAIERDENQPRTHFDEEKLQELASSIRTYGVLSPILVRPSPIPGHYRLVSGERRFRASHLAGLATIPAIVDQGNVDGEDRTLAIQLVENLQRADLSPLERAQAIGALRDSYSLSVRDIAERLGVSKSMVQRSLDLLQLPPDLLNALREGASESKILLLATVNDPEIRAQLLKDLDVLTRDQLQKELGKGASETATTKTPEIQERRANPEDIRIADEIQRNLGMKVKLSRSESNPQAGRVLVEFYSEQDLQEIFRRLVA